MSPLWDYFWPVLGVGLVLGLVSGLAAFRRTRRRWPIIGVAAVLTLAAAALWHGPLGAAERFRDSVETAARTSLTAYEMTQVHAHLQHDPLTRRLLLSGPADEFQTTELVRILSTLPGVSRATWSPQERDLPLFVEALLVSAGGFLLGLIVAYLVELRRRYNAQWSW
ncbi:MAG TPA: hypothetical protein VFI88_03590 [Sphingomicrobium sp.]|jgi:hypothetical protein|nr:hypothetical protein [Sphingomicrobium sp.]